MAIQQKASASGGKERLGPSSKALVSVGGNKSSTALIQQKKAATLPKPQWHPPWKLMRVTTLPFHLICELMALKKENTFFTEKLKVSQSTKDVCTFSLTYFNFLFVFALDACVLWAHQFLKYSISLM